MIKIKIGVFSDSHDHMENIRKAIEIFLEQKVEKIVHCGDIVAPFMVRAMSELKGKPIIEWSWENLSKSISKIR